MARALKVLFDPTACPAASSPGPCLGKLLDMLNRPELSPIWQAEETIGWVYQFFNEPEKAEDSSTLQRQAEAPLPGYPAATQLFTPNWIVRFLVQNTWAGCGCRCTRTRGCWDGGAGLPGAFRRSR